MCLQISNIISPLSPVKVLGTEFHEMQIQCFCSQNICFCKKKKKLLHHLLKAVWVYYISTTFQTDSLLDFSFLRVYVISTSIEIVQKLWFLTIFKIRYHQKQLNIDFLLTSNILNKFVAIKDTYVKGNKLDGGKLIVVDYLLTLKKIL